MNSAEFKTLRESLGLTRNWICKRFNVQESTVKHWESKKAPPADVVALINEVERYAEHLAHSQLEIVAELKKEIKDQLLNENGGVLPTLTLLRYRSDYDLWLYHPEFGEMGLGARFHSAVLDRTRRLMTINDIPTRIVYFEVEEYEDWLQHHDYQDSSQKRAQWASEQGEEND